MFSITPKGYYFRKRLHRRLDGIANEFKKNPQLPMDSQQMDPTDRGQFGYSAPAAVRVIPTFSLGSPRFLLFLLFLALTFFLLVFSYALFLFG